MIPRALNAPLSWIDERSQGVGVASDEARAGLATPQARSGLGHSETIANAWLPIATAPKDGTAIILGSPEQEYQGKPVEPRSTVGHWLAEEECREAIGDCGGECRCPEYKYHDPYWMSYDGGFTEENPPTHWQPLPAPPAQGARPFGEARPVDGKLIGAVVEEAEQACRYLGKHNQQGEATDYSNGFQDACELLGTGAIIADHVKRHIDRIYEACDAQGTSVRMDQDAERLEAKPAGPVVEDHAPEPSTQTHTTKKKGE